MATFLHGYRTNRCMDAETQRVFIIFAAVFFFTPESDIHWIRCVDKFISLDFSFLDCIDLFFSSLFSVSATRCASLLGWHKQRLVWSESTSKSSECVWRFHKLIFRVSNIKFRIKPIYATNHQTIYPNSMGDKNRICACVYFIFIQSIFIINGMFCRWIFFWLIHTNERVMGKKWKEEEMKIRREKEKVNGKSKEPFSFTENVIIIHQNNWKRLPSEV